ncbi:MAG: hypothetical protein WCY98_06025 [Castellaniella sp.]
MAAVITTHWRLRPLYAWRGRSSRPSPRALARRNDGRWLVYCGGASVQCCALEHAWRGPCWISLRLRPVGPGRPQRVTLWRARLGRSGWHGLRIWVARDLALSTPDPEV